MVLNFGPFGVLFTAAFLTQLCSVCAVPIRGNLEEKSPNISSSLVKEYSDDNVTLGVAENLAVESKRSADKTTKADSVPDQPLLMAISATSLVMQWSVSITSSNHFSIELYCDADLKESHVLPANTRQYIFQNLLPFTLYSTDLAICTGTTCGPRSAMAFAATWPSTPSAPLGVKARPSAYNSLEITWNPPAFPNGQIEVYVAVTVQPYRECYSDTLQYRRCYIHDLPANITLEVLVCACNLPNTQQQGGGCGAFSDVVITHMWNGGLEEELMVALAADNFTHEGIEAESTKSLSLYLPLSLIALWGTGPLNNISLVVQLAQYYEGPENPVLVLYDNHPYDDGVFHNHPIMGPYRSHEVYDGWEVLVTGSMNCMWAESLHDCFFVLGDGTGFPRNSHYFNGPLDSNTKYAIRLRLYSQLGYATTRPIFFKTAEVPIYTSFVIGIPMGAVMLITIGFALYRRLRLKWIQSRMPMEVEEFHELYKRNPPRHVKFSISYIYPGELLQTRIVSPVDVEDFNAYVFYLLNGPDCSLNIQYRLLQVMINQQASRFQLTSKIAELLAGKMKRSPPYDQSVVLLGASWTQLLAAQKSQNDVRDITTTAVFIDASYVCAPDYEDMQSGCARVAPNDRHPDFIVATSPTRSTVGDFLFMLVQQRTKVVVMLDDSRIVNESAMASTLVEDEEEDYVATVPYWPVEEMVNLENFFSTYHVCQIIRHSEQYTHDCCCRMLSVTPVDVMQPWPLTQLQFTGWPRHGVPRVDIFYHFVIKCLKYLNNFPVGSEYGPPTVHSRPNDGRAGTFVCAVVLLNQLRNDSQKVDVFGTVLALSKFRPHIITSQDHLQFLYLFVQYCIDIENSLLQSEDEEL